MPGPHVLQSLFGSLEQGLEILQVHAQILAIAFKACRRYPLAEKKRDFFDRGLPFFLVCVAGSFRICTALMDALMAVMTQRHELYVLCAGIVGICSAVCQLRMLAQVQHMMNQRCTREPVLCPAHLAFIAIFTDNLFRELPPIPVIVEIKQVT